MMKNKKFIKICSFFMLLLITGQTYIFVSSLVHSTQMIQLRKISNIETGGDAYDVWVDDQLKIAYVTCGYKGLRIFNISDLTNPVLLAHVPESSPLITETGHDKGYAHQLFVDNNIVYIGDGPSGLTIINCSDLSNPSVLIHYVGGYTWDIQINDAGNVAYIVNGWNNLGNPGFMILNVTNPSEPILLSNTWTSGDFTDLELVGNKVYLVKNRSGLRIMDVSNYSNPVDLGQYEGPSDSYAVDVEISGNLAFLSFWKNGLEILDISDPANISLVGEFKDSNINEFSFLTIYNDLAYIATNSDGVVVLNVSDTNFPVVGAYNDTGKAYNIFARENYIFVADQDEGLKILELFATEATIPAADLDISILAFVVCIFGFKFTKKGKKRKIR